jgi:probable HAF family extracellular repeat protein
MAGLGFLSAAHNSSVAVDVSADGSVVVGYSSSSSGAEAFRWTEGRGMVALGDLPGAGSASLATAVSADGSIVLGVGNVSGPRGEGFIWDAANGMRSLQAVLVNDFGLDLTGWTLLDPRGISDDGLAIVGIGTNPSGDKEAFLAIIPEPSTALLLASGLTALALRRRAA